MFFSQIMLKGLLIGQASHVMHILIEKKPRWLPVCNLTLDMVTLTKASETPLMTPKLLLFSLDGLVPLEGSQTVC